MNKFTQKICFFERCAFSLTNLQPDFYDFILSEILLDVNKQNTVFRLSLMSDYEPVHEILRVTWLDTYRDFVPQEDLLWYLEREYSREKYQQILLDPDSQAFLALVNDQPAGWMRVRFPPDCLNIVSLYILPQFQKNGIGSRFLSMADDIAHQRHYMYLTLGVMSDNHKSKSWYEHQGFRFTTEEPFTIGKTEVLHLIGTKQVTN